MDDHLTQQLFQSAYVGEPHEEVVTACSRLGEEKLQQKLLNLLKYKPFPHDEIQLELEEE